MLARHVQAEMDALEGEWGKLGTSGESTDEIDALRKMAELRKAARCGT